jgi:hypothetical protein
VVRALFLSFFFYLSFTFTIFFFLFSFSFPFHYFLLSFATLLITQLKNYKFWNSNYVKVCQSMNMQSDKN